MLQIVVPATEDLFDERTECFISSKETVLKLEHSLLSISKWESKWCKPFLTANESERHTPNEMYDYIKCMTLNNNVPEEVYNALTLDNMKDIFKYMDSPMTATTITNVKKRVGKPEVFTSEVIYYYMIAYGIPFECEKWHINRLITLIKVCSAKNNPEKMSRQDLLANNRALNAARRKALRTRG